MHTSSLISSNRPCSIFFQKERETCEQTLDRSDFQNFSRFCFLVRFFAVSWKVGCIWKHPLWSCVERLYCLMFQRQFRQNRHCFTYCEWTAVLFICLPSLWNWTSYLLIAQPSKRSNHTISKAHIFLTPTYLICTQESYEYQWMNYGNGLRKQHCSETVPSSHV